MIIITLFVFSMSTLLSNASIADPGQLVVSESRYVVTSVGAMQEQQDLLSIIIEKKFEETTKTIEQALKVLLEENGFHLDVSESSPPEQFIFLGLDLPKSQRFFGPITLRDALTVLAGKSFTVEVNPVTRTVFYRLDESYKGYISPEDVQAAKKQWLALNIQESEKISSSQPMGIVNNEWYGPVKSGETLRSIAIHFRPNTLTIDQTLIWLFQHNFDAFGNDNINHLLAGTFLNVPGTEETQELSKLVSSNLVDTHNKAWHKMRETP